MQLYCGARDAIHEATAIGWLNRQELDPLRYGCRIDISPASSANRIICDYTEAGRILRAVDQQPDAVRRWLLYAYGADPSKNDRAILSESLFRQLFQSRPRGQFARLHRLCSLAVDDLKIRYNSLRTLPVEVYLHDLGIDLRRYNREQLDVAVREVHARLEEYDCSGLAPVKAALDELAGLRRNGVDNAA